MRIYKSRFYSGMSIKNRRKLARSQNLIRSTNKRTGAINQIKFARLESRSDRWFKKTYTARSVSTSNILSWLLFGVVVVFLFAFIVRGADGRVPTFYGFLKMLASAPPVNVQFSNFLITFGDWGIFNFLRDFIELLSRVVSFVGWIGTCLWSFLNYAFYFLRWLYFGA